MKKEEKVKEIKKIVYDLISWGLVVNMFFFVILLILGGISILVGLDRTQIEPRLNIIFGIQFIIFIITVPSKLLMGRFWYSK
jgi:hypothetical protein